MTSYSNQSASATAPFASAPVLIAGDSDAALARAEFTVSAAGFRIGSKAVLEAAAERIAQQAAASAVWLDLDEDGGAALDRVLDQSDRDTAAGRYRAVIAAPASLIDVLAARVDDDGAELVIDGTESDRIPALATACFGSARHHRLSDVAADQSAERLRQLSDEVSRIAAALARLSSGPEPAAPRAVERPAEAELPDISADTVRAVIRARRLRGRYFSEQLFADPAWDMLLDLFHGDQPASGARVEPVHRRRGPGHHRIAMAQDDDRPGAVQPPRRPA